MADKKFSELTTASEIKNEDFMALSQNTGGGLVSLKATILAIANKMLKGINFTSDLQTEDKTVIGAINEVAQGGGGGGSSTLDGLTDVDIDDTTLADGQSLVYDEIEEKWVNGQGGGGTGGHTIIDENGNSMSARAGLQFVGADVSDDATNNKTIVDLASAGGIDGVFIDTTNVIQASTPITSSADVSYTATEDCIIVFAVIGESNNSANVQIDGVKIWEQFLSGSVSQFSSSFLLKKGQTAKFHQTYGGGNGWYIAYGIQTGTTHSKFQPIIYSTEEREIGVWIDKKPLYAKTLPLISPPSPNSLSTIADLSAYNIDTMVLISGNLYAESLGQTIPIKWSFNSSLMGTVFHEQNNLKQIIPSGYTNCSENITIFYTKTTDVAGSGSWTPQGVPTHHYSEDEQIVGTWKGKTLYERMFEVSHTFTQGDNDIELQSNVDFVSSDIKTYDATTVLSNGSASKRVSALPDDTLYVNSSNKLIMYFNCINPSSVGTRTVRVVAQYTKSSS